MMKKRTSNEFDIPYAGMALGLHQFNFEIGDSFFKDIEYSEIEQGNIKAGVELLKESTMLVLNFSLQGSVKLMCDRCLESYDQTIKGNFKLIVKFGEDQEELSDELVTIPADSSSFNLTHYLYEYIILLLPLKHVHPDDKDGNHTCNTDMLNRLDEYSETKTDPRWAALKDIKLD